MTNQDSNKLGFGLMRLPRKGVGIDIGQTKRMVDLFLEAGFRYFDTAYVYIGSEAAAKKALVDRHPRDSYTLATKLFATTALSSRAARQQLDTSIKRTGAEYFDYYLLHALMEGNYRKFERFGLWDFVAEKKKQGDIRNVGFSFHGKPALLERLLKEHPEVDFVQLQLNYADWDNPSVAARENYEIARSFGKPIVVMEPVKGGRLAKPDQEIVSLMREYDPKASPASWAIRFAASLEGVETVLSGMSTVEQTEDNISYMRNFQPLNADEHMILREAQKILGKSKTIPCTGCRYCVADCPESIPIPDVFEAMNLRLGSGQIARAREAYAEAVAGSGKASDCISCGQCEKTCPQHLNIPSLMKQCESLER